MVRLKSRTQCPVNGFMFRQPETNAEFHTWDFEGLAQQVQAHRQQNPRFNLSTDLNTIRGEIDTANAMRMLSIRNADSYITQDGGGTPPNRLAPRGLKRAAVVVGGGVKVLHEWLGAGGVPVGREAANDRAAACAACPLNAQGDWTAWFTEPVAALIRAQLGIRGDMNLTTPFDDQLNVCDACGCPLKLKVHVPLEHIKNNLPDDVRAKLHFGCWILRELKVREG